MRLIIAAFTVALLVGTASAQNPETAGTAANTTSTGAEAAPAPGSVGITISPKTRKRLLKDLLNAVAPPRPTAAPAETVSTLTVETPAGIPSTGTDSPTLPPPRPATGVALTPAPTALVPRPAATTVPKPQPPLQPAEPAATPRPIPDIAPSAPIDPPPVQPPVGVAAPAVAPPTVSAPAVIAPAEPTPATFGASTMMLLGLLAALAAVAAATVMRVQRVRRIERTRAALVVAPRIDLAAGASSIHGLSLVGPPLAIRARLAT